VFRLALLSQALQVLFVKLVEQPHMDRLYADTRRTHTPAIQALLPYSISQDAERIQAKAVRELFLLYRGVTSPRLRDDHVTLSVPDTITARTPITVQWRASCDFVYSNTDWLGLYKVDVASAPGMSRGRYVMVPAAQGSILFPSSKMPAVAGVYEMRYHTHDYQIVGRALLAVLKAPSRRSSVEDMIVK
jgi:hypothetical protein